MKRRAPGRKSLLFLAIGRGAIGVGAIVGGAIGGGNISTASAHADDDDACNYYGARLSPDGQSVVYPSCAEANRKSKVAMLYRHDLLTNTRIQLELRIPDGCRYWFVIGLDVSRDGRYAAIACPNRLSPDGRGSIEEILRVDFEKRTARVISTGLRNAAADGPSLAPSISNDGRTIAFVSYATNLVPDDTNGESDVFCWDAATDTITLASPHQRKTAPSTRADEGGARAAYLSGNGRYVAFSLTNDHVSKNENDGASDVFCFDRETSRIELISVDELDDDGGHSKGCTAKGISDDGRFVLFTSHSERIKKGDSNNEGDVFVRDRLEQSTTLMSLNSQGQLGNGESGRSLAMISGDGRHVVFDSTSTNLTEPSPGLTLAYVSCEGKVTRALAPTSNEGRPSNDYFVSDLSSDGRWLLMNTNTPGLDSRDHDEDNDVFRVDMQSGELMCVTCEGE